MLLYLFILFQVIIFFMALVLVFVNDNNPELLEQWDTGIGIFS